MNIINMARSEQVGDITVHASGRGHVRFVVWKDGKDLDFVLNMKDAVQLYRRLVGEVDFSMNVEGEPPVYVAYRQREDAWTLSFRGIVAVLDQDDSLALAWGVRSVIESLVAPGANRGASCGSARGNKWTLKLAFVNGCSKREPFVFETKDDALSALREFIRPAVNELIGESQDIDVDTVIDTVISQGGDCGPWIYNGFHGSFKATISQVNK